MLFILSLYCCSLQSTFSLNSITYLILVLSVCLFSCCLNCLFVIRYSNCQECNSTPQAMHLQIYILSMQRRRPACTCMYLCWPWALCFSAEHKKKEDVMHFTLSSSFVTNDKNIPGCLCQEIKLCRGNCGSLPLVHRLVCVG